MKKITTEPDWALWLARHDFHVFPVDHPSLPQCVGSHTKTPCDGKRGKHPAANWPVAATVNEKMVATWWRDKPVRNIGIACGPSRLVVIDEDGHGELDRWCSDHHLTLPPTFAVHTGRGQHYYFRAPDGVEIGNANGCFRGYKIDVRGVGGYVIGPGSVHESGQQYQLAAPTGEPVPLPDELAALLAVDTNTTPTPAAENVVPAEPAAELPVWLATRFADAPVEVGTRSEAFFGLATACKSAGFTPGQTITAMRTHYPAGVEKYADRHDDQVVHCWEEGAPPEPSQPGLTFSSNDPANGQPADSPGVRRAKITWANEIEPKPVVWAWKDGDEGRIPAGCLSLLAGREGTGKSQFGIWEIAQITRGTLPGSLFGQPSPVLIVAMEDSWQHTIVPRLIAAGADLSMVGRFDVVIDDDDEVRLSLPHDNDLLEKAITEYGVKLVLIDPIMSVLSESINAGRSREVRRALDPLAKIADSTGCLIQGIAHFNKANGSDASSRIQESSAFKDVPRSLFVFAKDDDGRVMTETKNNLGRDDLPSYSYTIEAITVNTKQGIPAETSRLVLGETSERTVGDMLDDDGGERDEAVRWLKDYLTDAGGSAGAGDTIKAAAAAGIAKTTLTRARGKAKVDTEKAGFGNGWVWTLRDSVAKKTAEESTKNPEGTTVQNGDSSGPFVDSSVADPQAGDAPSPTGQVCPACWQTFDNPNALYCDACMSKAKEASS